MNLSMLKEAFKYKGVRYIMSGWAFFIAENVIVSHNKITIIDNFGEDSYYRLYNLLSTCACGGLFYSWYFYGRKRGPIVLFHKLSNISHGVGFSLQSLGLVGLSQLLPPLQIPISSIPDNKYSEKPSASENKSPFSINLRCPIDLKAYQDSKNKDSSSVYGIERVSRHAVLWSMGIFFLGSAASTIYLTEIVMGTSPILFSLIGTFHQDYRRKYLGNN